MFVARRPRPDDEPGLLAKQLSRPARNGPRELLARGSDDFAISDVEDATGDAGNPSVVGHNNDGLLEIPVQLLEQIENFLARLRVQLSCRFVR